LFGFCPVAPETVTGREQIRSSGVPAQQVDVA
jgi:hypothetical protein